MKSREALDELDLQIIRELQKNSRQSARKIAEKLGVAVGTVNSRIQKLEKEGVIQNYHCHVDYGKLGYNVTAIIGMKVRREHWNRLEEMLEENKNVYAVLEVTGEFDFIIAVIFRDIGELNNFIRSLPPEAVKETHTFLVLKRVKEGHYLV